MKKHIIIISAITILLILSCSVNNKDIVILKILNQFETQKLNEQLGKDLLSYNYSSLLKNKIPELSNEDLKNIRWQYFIQESNNEISFRLILLNISKTTKEKIIEIIEKVVDSEIQHRVENISSYEKASELSLKYIDNLNKLEFDSLWIDSSNILKRSSTKNQLAESFKIRKYLKKDIGNPIIAYRKYFENNPKIKETKFYVVGVTYENDNISLEQFTYHENNNKLEIVGYDANIAEY